MFVVIIGYTETIAWATIIEFVFVVNRLNNVNNLVAFYVLFPSLRFTGSMRYHL